MPPTPFEVLKKAVESDPPEQVYSITRDTMRDFFAAFERLEQAFIGQTFFLRELSDRADIYQCAIRDILRYLSESDDAVGPSVAALRKIADGAIYRANAKRQAN